MSKSFNKWCEKLLDTGKGNRLINFKDSNSRTIQIYLPDGNYIFDKLSSGVELSVFDYESQKKNKATEIFDNGTMEEINEYVFKQLSSTQIFVYKQSYIANSILNNLKKLSKDYLTEKGINILFAAFGFLNWTDKNGDKLKSPLVLFPISIESKSKLQPFVIKEYSDEITTNPTLIYKLKFEMNVNLPEFRQGENSNETLIEYYNRVTEFAKNNGWEVSREVQIGLFSYLKLNMYKDLKENEEMILANPLIKKLLNQSDKEVDNSENVTLNFDNLNENNSIDESMLENSINNVVDCDSSQMMAIMKAKLGESFVLQGPPGTGKSQTITNLIAEFLYDGKKILFVSEKLAALKVVYNNLKKADLADFCLELHSEKSNKKEFLSELHNMLSSDKKYVDTENVEFSISGLKSAEKILDNYVTELHKKVQGIDKTPFEIANEISKYREIEKFEYAFHDINSKGRLFHENAERLLENYRVLSESIGYDYHENSWYGFSKTSVNFEQKIQLKRLFDGALRFFKTITNHADYLLENAGINVCSISNLKSNFEFLNCLKNLKFFDKNLFLSENLGIIYDYVQKITAEQDKLSKLENELYSVFSNEIFGEDINKLYLKFENKYNSFFRIFSKEYKSDKNLILSYASVKKLGYSKIINFLKIARDICNLKQQILQNESSVFDNLYQDMSNKKLDWKEFETELEMLVKFDDKFSEKLSTINYPEFVEIQNQINELLLNYNNINEIKIDDIQTFFDKNICDYEKIEFEKLISKFESLIENFDELENWTRFYNCFEEIKKLDIADFIDEFINEGFDRKNLINIFNSIYYEQWFYNVLSKSPTLSNFSKQTQDMAVENFILSDKEKFDISKAKIMANLTSMMPNLNMMGSGGQIVNIEREYNKKTRQKPIRVLLKEASELIQTLKPCFLMSPLSVSTYLEFGTCNFDVVIFDEASQIFPWDSIGAIARGKQVIVVGDSRQLPPTDFFSTNIASDGDYDEENGEGDDSLDFESILDLCSATFNQNRLNWHYRSKTEDLITFSNKNFYDNSLVTFPSAIKDNFGVGIEFHYVENGVFSRKTRANIVEAEQVADLVFEHYMTRPNMSLGVVAFSISQQHVIENLISKRREENPELDKYFENSVEPFFVKNLESVQGDERDVIIFSIAYAKDEDGKFIHNFGPLNKQGGERRLNVAISRAKYNVKVVSSIKSTNIDLSKTSSVGAKMLKDYLYMAEIGVNNWTEKKSLGENSKSHCTEIVNEICEFLTKKGFDVQTNVGSSELKIDICVKHPERTDYVVAIECDGGNYRSGKTTRDRDRLRKEVLERLGWKYYRVWTLEWTVNKKSEKNKLINFINFAIKEFDDNLKNNTENNANLTKNNDKNAENSKNQSKNYIVEEKFEKKDLKSLFKTYEEFDVESKMPTTFDRVIFDIVKLEAPITEQLLMKKTAILFGREKVTAALKEIFERNIVRFKDRIFKIDDFYVVDKNMMIELRVPKKGAMPRDIMMISNMELASGLYQIISSNFGITEKGLFMTIANLLGFSKVGTNIQSKLEDSLKMILDKNMVKLVDGQYFKS